METRSRFVALALIGLGLLAGCGDAPDEHPGELHDHSHSTHVEPDPMCPWRNPAADIAAWFPAANRCDTEIRILSGLRPELTQRLGRIPTAAENALYVHQVWDGSILLGEVVVRRVKGESGVVELAVALEPDGQIRGLRFQRSREPEAVSAALNGAWLAAFRGKRGTDVLQPGQDLPSVPAVASPTAWAVAEGVRNLLILREVAADPRALRRPAPEVAIAFP